MCITQLPLFKHQELHATKKKAEDCTMRCQKWTIQTVKKTTNGKHHKKYMKFMRNSFKGLLITVSIAKRTVSIRLHYYPS